MMSVSDPPRSPVAKMFGMRYGAFMTAIVQFKFSCNGKRARWGCSSTICVEADSVSYARKLIFRDDGWTAMQIQTVIYDYCPHCDPRKTEDNVVTFITARANVRATTHMTGREKVKSREQTAAQKAA